MANANASLNSLHQNLTDEVSKLVRWEVETVVARTDTETQLKQTEETILKQEEVICQLQHEKDQALEKNITARNKRKEIEMQVHHTVSEVEVLIGKFSGLQAQVKELTSSPLCPYNMGSEDDLAEAVSKMRIEAMESISKKRREIGQLDQELNSIEATSKSCQEGWTNKISTIKAQIDEAMVTLSLKEDRLLQVNSDINLKTRTIETLTKNLQSMNEQLVHANQAMTDTKKANEEKVLEKRRTIEARKEEVAHLETSNKRKKGILENRRKEAFDKKRQTEKLSRKMEKGRQEILEKEKALQILQDDLSLALEKVKESKVKTAVRGKLDRDMEMLKEDLKACHEKRRILEKELKNFSKIKQLKDASDEEKSNLEGRLKLLKDKDQSYLEDLNLWKDRLQEAEETGGAVLSKITEVKVKVEKNTNELSKIKSSLTEKVQENTEISNRLLEMDKKVEEVNLQRRYFLLEEESIQSETELALQERIILSSKSEALADSSVKLENEKLALMVDLDQVVEYEEDLKKKMENIERSRISLSDSFQNLSKEVEEKEKKEKELVSKIAVKKEINKKLGDEVKEFKGNTALNEERLKALVQKEEELIKEMGILKRKEEKEERRLKSLKKPDDELADAEKSIETLEKEIKATQEEYSRVRAEEGALLERIESLNHKINEMREEEKSTSLELSAAEKDVNQLRKCIEIKEGELSSLQKSNIQEDEAVEETERKRLVVEADIQQLRNLEKEESEKYRVTLDQKAKAHSERCKPLEENRTAILKRIAEIEEAVKKVDVKVKTQKAKRNRIGTEKSKMSKVAAKKATGDLALVESQILDLERKIEAQNRMNSALDQEVERLQYVNHINDDKSDDEDIKPRKFSVPTPANVKRKLTDSKPDLNVFDMDCSSGGDSQSSQFHPPSTPVRNSKLLPSVLSSSINNSINKKPTLAAMIDSDKTLSGRPGRKLPTPPKRPLLDLSQSSQKKGNTRRNQTTQEPKQNDDLDLFEFTSQSQ